jgi:UDP-glucose 4-epimerase
VDAHRLALERAPALGFGRYIVTATTPFAPEDAARLREDAPGVLRERVPEYEAVYAARGWTMLPQVGRVYDNARARADLGWAPAYGFRAALRRLGDGEDPRSPLALTVGAKGYHAEPTGIYTAG